MALQGKDEGLTDTENLASHPYGLDLAVSPQESDKVVAEMGRDKRLEFSIPLKYR